MLAIARAMVKPAKIMVIDDATAILNYANQQKVLSLIQSWRDEGRTVLFFSNNLDHLFAVTDEILVLCDTCHVKQFRTDETSREEVVGAMVGTTDTDQITPFIWALDNYYRARERAEELRQNQVMLERDLYKQDTLNKELIDQLNKQVIALDKANRALQDAHKRLMSRRELERKGLARDLHDQTIQDLFTVNYQLERLESDEKVPVTTATKIHDIRLNIRGLIEDLRVVCGNLRPPTIDSLGVGAAITSFANEWSKKANIETTIDIDRHLIRLPEETELSIYRIVQEALNNIRKHAQAKNVWLRSAVKSGDWWLEFEDDGNGFLPEDIPTTSRYGLHGMRERAELIGADFQVVSKPDQGTLIRMRVPANIVQDWSTLHLRGVSP